MSKTMIRFFTIADYEEEEIWLRKQHQSGWKIVKMIPHCVLRNEAEKAQNEVRRLNPHPGFLKNPLRKGLLVTQRHVVGYMAKGGEGYVQIHHGRDREALRRYGPNGAVL